MSKRARRLGKKNELRAVEEAIGASLGKKSASTGEPPTARERGMSGKTVTKPKNTKQREG
jgi:hypothetical protein